MSLEGLLLFLILLYGGLLVVLLLAWLIRRASTRKEPLKPHYLRLGRTAPSDACPCGRSDPSLRCYGDCCRPADVQVLTEDVQAFLWKHWSHHSFAGRRRSRAMKHRLEDFPLPPLSLPEWVERPEKFTFPISEEELRRWNPLSARAAERRAADIEEETAPGDLF